MNKITIALAEDHELVRQGMMNYLKEDGQIDILFDVGNGSLLLNELEHRQPEIILLDIAMPELSGIELLKILGERYPDIKIMVISGYYTEPYISQSLLLGARTFLPKYIDLKKLREAISTVHESGYFFYEKTSRTLFEKLAKLNKKNPLWHEHALTKREIEILKLVCQEKSNDEIAQLMFLSKRTIEDYKNSILSKTESKNVVGLVLYSIKQGIIPDPATTN